MTEFALAGGAALLVLVGIVVAVMACRRWRKKKNAQNQSYMMSNLGDTTSDGDEFFDDNINDPPAGLLSHEFNLHLSDDEF
jgi:hypothetical protein